MLDVASRLPGGAAAGSAGRSARRECAVRAVRIAGIVLVSYVLIVVAFESLIGFFQPEAPDTLVLTTVGEDGGAVDRVLQGLQSGRSALRGGQSLAPRLAPSRPGESPGAGDARRGDAKPHGRSGDRRRIRAGRRRPSTPPRVPCPDRLSASPPAAAGPGGVTIRVPPLPAPRDTRRARNGRRCPRSAPAARSRRRRSGADPHRRRSGRVVACHR